MNSIEDRARNGLRQLAEPVENHAELPAVFDSGRRLRRQRRAGLLAAGATAVVAALVGTLFLPGSLSQNPITASPSPTAASSVTAQPNTGPHKLGAPVTPGTGAYRNGLRSLEGTATQVADGWDIEIDAVTRLGDRIHRTGHAGSFLPAVLHITDQVWVAVASNPITWLQPAQVGGGIADVATYPYNSMPLIEYVLSTSTTTGTLAGFLWRDSSGSFWNDQGGGPLEHGVFSVDHVAYWFVRDLELRLACGVVAGPTDSGGTTSCYAPATGLPLREGVTQLSFLVPGATAATVQFGALPIEAADFELTVTRSGCLSSIGRLETGPAAFVLRCPGKVSGDLFSKIRYKETQSGPWVTVRPSP